MNYYLLLVLSLVLKDELSSKLLRQNIHGIL
jgi:hypothetical protein